MSKFLKVIKTASLFVLFLSVVNLRCADDSMILPYDESVVDDTNTQPMDTSYAQQDQPVLNETSAPFQDNSSDAMPLTAAPGDNNPFTEVNLDPTTFRSAKQAHTNLIMALTQQEQRDNSNQVSGGDINSGFMREVEQGVLSNIAQHFDDIDDPSKITFIRLDVTKNTWIWNYFNDGTSAQSVDKKNGTPQYLFFNNGNLVSVLIGNRDDSAFANWVRSNTTGQSSTPSDQNQSNDAPTDTTPESDLISSFDAVSPAPDDSSAQ